MEIDKKKKENMYKKIIISIILSIFYYILVILITFLIGFSIAFRCDCIEGSWLYGGCKYDPICLKENQLLSLILTISSGVLICIPIILGIIYLKRKKTRD